MKKNIRDGLGVLRPSNPGKGQSSPINSNGKIVWGEREW